jgi:DNA invertase Pin-like site-specific DNA recombinase
MKSKALTKAASYLRCSGLGQVGGDTWARQTAAIAKYAKQHGLQVVDEFRDAGVSGTKDLDNRPGLAALLGQVESNGVKIVLVENATRLARDLMVSEVILQQLTNAGCQVIAADSGTDLTADSDDPTRRLIRQVLGAVAEFDRRVTVMKLRAARERKRSRGERCEGRKPFGTLHGEVQTLLRIRELRRKPPNGRRRSLQQVCDALNAEGLPTRSGKPWTKQAVNRILGRGSKAGT